MPFANQRGFITGLLEQGRNGGMLRGQSKNFDFVAEVFSFGERFFKTHAGAGRISSGDERAARRGAYRRRGIGVEETDALPREAIEVWSLVIGAAVTTQIAVAEIVGEDEKNVWSTVLGEFECGNNCGAGDCGANEFAARDVA